MRSRRFEIRSCRNSVLGVAMADKLRVMLEIGPKGKKVVAVAPDWPGLERGAKDGETAIARLQSYLPRYAKVAKLAGMDAAFAAITALDHVEHYPGTGSTDFWGISFAFSNVDRQEMRVNSNDNVTEQGVRTDGSLI